MVMSERYQEAMSAVLGSMLISTEPVAEVMSTTTEEMFLLPQARTVYGACRRLWLERQPVDPVAVLAICGDGYRDYLKELMDVTPTWRNAGLYAKVLGEEFRLQKLREAAEDILAAPDLSAAREAYQAAEPLIVGQSSKVTSLQTALEHWWQDMYSGETLRWLDWGFDRLNANLHVAPGDFVVFGADSSVGKTAFAVQAAYAMAKSGKRVAIFSAETDERILTRRLMAQQAGMSLPSQQLRMIGKSQQPAVLSTIRESSPLVLDIVDASDMTLDGIRAHCVAGGYEVIWIDYLQLLDGPGNTATEQVRAISKYFRRMSRALNVTVIGLSQLTVPEDAPKNWRPTKESLRESRQLKNDADQILLMYLVDRKVPSGARRLDIVKQKEGTLGRMIFDFKGSTMSFKLRPKTDGVPEDEEGGADE